MAGLKGDHSTRLFLVVLTVFLFSAAKEALGLRPQGCTWAKCQFLKKRRDKLNASGLGVGFWMGEWNKRYHKGLINKIGGPFVDYGVFTEIGDILTTTSASSLSDCCSDCAKADGCWLYHFFDRSAPTEGKKAVVGFKNGAQCYLLTGGSEKKVNKVFGLPASGDSNQQTQNLPLFDPSWVGGLCNGNASVVDDPHFTGALGTRFDFNGQLDKSFCLTADSQLQVNILLCGYHDGRLLSQASEEKKAEKKSDIRSWIKEIGLIWKAGAKVHRVHLSAQRGNGSHGHDGAFLERMEMDGVRVAVPKKRGEVLEQEGGFSLKMSAVEVKGPYVVDHFVLNIEGLTEINLRLRMAHKLLQQPNDPYIHFNVHFSKLEASPSVHGILGQTFRTTEEQFMKAKQFTKHSSKIHGPVVVDEESGRGFLEGETKDYLTSNILATDCLFSPFSDDHENKRTSISSTLPLPMVQ